MRTLIQIGTEQVRVVRVLFIILICSELLGISIPASATLFNLTFDPSTAGAPAAFFPAFNDAIQFYQTTFTDPVVINLHVEIGRAHV